MQEMASKKRIFVNKRLEIVNNQDSKGVQIT